MPTYEYRCERCGHTVEVVQSFTDAPLTTCESCGGALRKVYAPVGIVFKGSGFYKTDSRSRPSPPRPTGRPRTDGCGGRTRRTKKAGDEKRRRERREHVDRVAQGRRRSSAASTPAPTGAPARRRTEPQLSCPRGRRR